MQMRFSVVRAKPAGKPCARKLFPADGAGGGEILHDITDIYASWEGHRFNTTNL
jgi:hypothetical protein